MSDARWQDRAGQGSAGNGRTGQGTARLCEQGMKLV